MWDIFITVVLLFSCTITPVELALFEEVGTAWSAINWTIDALFLIDILVNFNAAFYNDDYELIDDRAIIAKEYLRGWFTVDVVAILPFQLMTPSGGEAGDLVRISRIGRMQKITKLLKLARLAKFAKSQSLNFCEGVMKLLNIHESTRMLFYFLFGFMGATHIIACFWIIFGHFDNDSLSWLHTTDYPTKSSLYLTSFYWAITTVTTVGYGDMPVTTFAEKIFAIILMFSGVIAFSFVGGWLTNLIMQSEHENALLAGKIAVLDRLHDEHDFELKLYSAIKMNLKSNYVKDVKSVSDLIDDLPANLKHLVT